MYISYGKLLPYSKKLASESRCFGDLILVDESSPGYLKTAIAKVISYAEPVCDFTYDISSLTYGNVYAFVNIPTAKDCPGIVYGACHFHHGRWEGDKKPPLWSLRWVWFHPSFRKKGILSKHWPYFVKAYGNFNVQPPLSESMQAFLLKHSNSNVLA